MGAIISPPDYRDGIASASALPALAQLTLPATFKTDLGQVLDQNKTPSCVSHSVVQLIKLYYFVKTGKWIDFSPRFLDTLVKRFDGQDRATGGTYPRMVMKLAAKYGCATTATLPNDTTLPTLAYRDDSKLTSEVFAEAEQYKIPGFIGIPLDFQSVRQAIYLYGAVSALFAIGDEFWTPSWAAKDIEPLRTPKKVESGHQLTPDGWVSPTLNLLRNEWSAQWADDGEATYDPKLWSPYVYEAWAIAEIPKDVASFLKALPSPADFHYTWEKDLKLGDFSDDVKFAQVAYMILGYLKPIPSEELGYFGPKTAAANLAFQTVNKIAPTAPNSIGPKTRAKLNARFAV